jgi:hypothetical protein
MALNKKCELCHGSYFLSKTLARGMAKLAFLILSYFSEFKRIAFIKEKWAKMCKKRRLKIHYFHYICMMENMASHVLKFYEFTKKIAQIPPIFFFHRCMNPSVASLCIIEPALELLRLFKTLQQDMLEFCKKSLFWDFLNF